jgi:WD40 repeat protein
MSPAFRYRDRELIVTSAGDSVRLFDVATGEQAGDALVVAGLERVLAVKVIGDRLLILAEVKDWHVGVWDLLARSPVAEPFNPFGADIDEPYSNTWCGDLAEYDGRLIAVLGGGVRWPMNSRIVVWDVVSRQAIGSDLTGHRFGVMAMKVESIDAQQLICTGGGDGTVRCWLWPHGDLNGEPIFAHAGGVDRITTVRAGDQLTVISAGRDGAVRSWDLGLIRSAEPDPDTTVRGLVCCSPNGRAIVTGITGGGQSMTTWDSATGQKIVEWAVDGSPDRALSVDVRGQTLIATDGDTADIRLWNPTSGQLETSLHLPAGTRIAGLATWNAGGQSFLVAASTDGKLHVWDVPADTPLYEPIACDPANALAAIWSIDDVPHIVTMGPSDTRPRLWNLATGQGSSTTLQPRQPDVRDSISTLAVGNFDGKPVAVCVGARCYAWDLRDGTLLLDSQLDDGHGMAIWPVKIGNLNGRSVVASSGYAGAVALWNLDASITQIVETGSPVFALAVDAGKRIICGGGMGILAIEITNTP